MLDADPPQRHIFRVGFWQATCRDISQFFKLSPFYKTLSQSQFEFSLSYFERGLLAHVEWTVADRAGDGASCRCSTPKSTSKRWRASVYSASRALSDSSFLTGVEKKTDSIQMVDERNKDNKQKCTKAHWAVAGYQWHHKPGLEHQSIYLHHSTSQERRGQFRTYSTIWSGICTGQAPRM